MKQLVALSLCALIAIAYSQAPSSSSRRNSDKMVDKHFSDKTLVFNSLGYVVESTNDGLTYLQSAVMTVDMGEPYLYAYQGEKGDCLNLDQAATDYSLHFANEQIYNVNSVSPDQYPIALIDLEHQPQTQFPNRLEYKKTLDMKSPVIIAGWDKRGRPLILLSNTFRCVSNSIKIDLREAIVVYGNENASPFDIRKGDILIQNSAVIGFLKNVDEETYTAFSTDVQLFS